MMAGVLAGCGIIPGGSTGSQGPGGTGGTGAQGDTNSPGQAASTGAANPSQSSGVDVLPYTKDYIDQHLTGDFAVSYDSVTEGSGTAERYALTRTAEGYYLEAVTTVMLYLKSGDGYDCYMRLSDGKFQKVAPATQAQVDSSVAAVTDMFVQHVGQSWGLKYAGTETIAGRDCDKYAAEVPSGGGSLTVAYWIDKATGVCLKYDYISHSPGETQNLGFVALEFKTSNVTLPSHG